MAMNNYITLGSYRYRCRFPDWRPWFIKPGSVRYTLAGNSDATYGSAVPQGWEGAIEVPYEDSGTYGGRSEFETTIKLMQAVPFIDHWGVSYNVHIIGEITFETLRPMIDGDTNKLYYTLRLEKA